MTEPPKSSVAGRVVIWFFVAVVVVSGIGAVIASVKQAREHDAWLAFRTAHRCKAVTHRDGESVASVSSDAKGPGTVTRYVTRGRTGWLCDDGVVHEVDDE